MDKGTSTLPKFYRCTLCGNIVEMIEASGVIMNCCGQKMELLIANDSDGASEKHVPVYDVDNCKVYTQVGSAAHPMSEEHHIDWIELVTTKGIQRKNIYPNDKPTAWFCIRKNEEPIAIYAYCNLHGLWGVNIK